MLIDLPEAARWYYHNNISAFDLHEKTFGHVDIPRLRKGRVGGFFWSVYVQCPKNENWLDGNDGGEGDEKDHYTDPDFSVRDTLEQIDVARGLISRYSDTFELVYGTAGIRRAMDQGKIASLLGVEGGHQLGNSLAVLRMYHALGVRYVTLTHMCHNAFADSGGFVDVPPPRHNGLSSFGRTLIKEMNRLGVLVDLAHTSDATALQALQLSEAPVIWSHSSARAVWNVSRNVPDDILQMIGLSENKKDALVMINFMPEYIAADGKADVEVVANHIEHVAKVAGRQHVGIGSDFDGILHVPKDLEDVSKYPNLFLTLYRRGWSAADLEGLAGRNLLRVFGKAEAVAKRLQDSGLKPAMEIYKWRKDL
ncbi:hypothetical protein FRC03_005185 [Tulasnella sp. 419]|nr:hypothetical protein FRC03_005185 [Tulasnella sp. 419]